MDEAELKELMNSSLFLAGVIHAEKNFELRDQVLSLHKEEVAVKVAPVKDAKAERLDAIRNKYSLES